MAIVICWYFTDTVSKCNSNKESNINLVEVCCFIFNPLLQYISVPAWHSWFARFVQREAMEPFRQYVLFDCCQSISVNPCLTQCTNVEIKLDNHAVTIMAALGTADWAWGWHVCWQAWDCQLNPLTPHLIPQWGRLKAFVFQCYWSFGCGLHSVSLHSNNNSVNNELHVDRLDSNFSSGSFLSPDKQLHWMVKCSMEAMQLS